MKNNFNVFKSFNIMFQFVSSYNEFLAVEAIKELQQKQKNLSKISKRRLNELEK